MKLRMLCVIWLASACHGNAARGALGGACYPNDTCNAALACVGGKCVAAPFDAALRLDAPPDAHADARVIVVDAPRDAPAATCNVLTQMGCASGQKCTWIIDAATPNALGHVGCAPDGTKTSGQSCTRNAPGAMGWDDCQHGNYCFGPDAGGAGTCKVICDPGGGNPMCPSTLACTTYDGLFGASGQPDVAGVCNPMCDPLGDNNFLGSNGNNMTGSGCGSAGSNGVQSLGCYGYPDGRNGVTHWTCTAQLNPTRVHRTACDTTQHTGDAATCSPAAMAVYINGCAAGYEPIYMDAAGSTQIDCIAMCKPGNCYNAGATGTTGGGTVTCGDTTTTSSSNLTGVAPHQCNTTDVQAASLQPAVLGALPSPGVNGEQCMYSWVFEFDASNNFVRSPTSDTLGFCIDHSKYNMPKCDLTGLGSAVNGGMDAAYYGCVSSTAAGIMAQVGPPRFDLRMPYHTAAGRR